MSTSVGLRPATTTAANDRGNDNERIDALASRVGVQIEAMEALCERMLDVGLSTQDVAECAGMTTAELTAAMRNERALTLEELGVLAYAVGARVVIRIETPRVRVVPID